jgi:hypothetical protein
MSCAAANWLSDPESLVPITYQISTLIHTAFVLGAVIRHGVAIVQITNLHKK